MTSASNLAFGVALVLYLAAMVGYFHFLSFRRDRVWRVARSLAIAGVAVHLGAIVTRGLAAGRVPWGNMYEYASVVGVLVVGGYLILERITKVRTVGGFALAGAVLAMATATLIYVPPGPLVPALNSYWIRIHVVAAMLGSSLFMLGFVFTVLYLVQERRERRAPQVEAQVPVLVGAGSGLPEDFAQGEEPPVEGAPGKRSRLPEAGVLDGLAHRTIAFGFPVWTFAVIAGAIWAEQAWGRYWGWDPKEVWAFITWAVFASYLHARSTVGWRGRRAAIIATVGFAALVFNLVVVNTSIAGLHSYA